MRNMKSLVAVLATSISSYALVVGCVIQTTPNVDADAGDAAPDAPSDASPDAPSDASPDAPSDASPDAPAVACPAGKHIGYKTIGCGASAVPTCLWDIWDACARSFCSCDGVTISGCEGSPAPYAAEGACAP